MDKEIWLPMKGYEGRYEVSSLGRVYSSRGCMMKVNKTKLGYMKMNLSEGGFIRSTRLHRAVAMTFLGNPEGKKEVNHIDGDKSNNRVDNLEWCTSSENKFHAVRTGLLPTKSGSCSSRAKLSDTEVDFLRYFASKGFTQVELSGIFGISKSVTSNIINYVTYKNKQPLLMNA
jgi:hypothetical protein